MNKEVLVLYDPDQVYAERFLEYIHLRAKTPFEAQAFTNAESLAAFAERERIDLLLVSEKVMNEQVRTLPAEYLIILSEEEFTEDTGDKTVYKYQSSEAIIREVMCFYAEQHGLKRSVLCIREETRLISVYSPVRRSLKTSFALTLGMVLAEKRPALYINLEEYAGFSTLFDKTYTGDISDLVYFMKQKDKNLLYKLKSMVCSVNGLDYIPPGICSYDLRSVEAGDWIRLINAISQCGGYSAIIMDLGESIQGLYDILNCCTRIYTPVREDRISQAKLYQYEKLLQMMDYPEILNHTRKLKFGYFRGMDSGMENLPYGQLGEYVRALLREEEYE